MVGVGSNKLYPPGPEIEFRNSGCLAMGASSFLILKDEESPRDKGC